MSNEPILTPAAFAAYIEQRLAANDDQIQIVGRDKLLFQLRVRGVPRALNLDSIYQAYTTNPQQLDAVNRTLLRVLLDDRPTATTASYADLREQIYPMLKPLELLNEVRKRGVAPIASRDLLGELLITYVIEDGRNLSYINQDHLDRWEISVVELHTAALANLHRRTTERVQAVASGDLEHRLYIFSSGDGFDATRLLLTDVLAGWAQSVPGNLVIGVPNRDFLIAFSDADEDVFDRVVQQIETDAETLDHALTAQLFTLNAGDIELYEV